MRGDIHEAYQAPQLKTQPASVGPQAGPCRARGGDSVAFCRHRPEECPPKVLAPTQPSRMPHASGRVQPTHFTDAEMGWVTLKGTQHEAASPAQSLLR